MGGGVSGLGGQALVDQLNTQISAYGVSASIDAATGQLNFNGGSTAFNVKAGAARPEPLLRPPRARRPILL